MRINAKLKIREIAGEKIVILERNQQIEFNNVMVLNKTSEWLWNELQGIEFDEAKVADLLQSKFEVEESKALSDAMDWIETLNHYDIIEEE